MTQTTDLKAIADALRQHDRFLVVTHENPDGDALGSLLASTLALRQLGKDVESAAIEAAALRFRPVMMTSFAFILGLFPLVVAQGAGALTRHAVGTPVFGGMIAASLFGIFIIPLLYITAERLRRLTAK